MSPSARPLPDPASSADARRARPTRRGTTKAGGQKHALDKFYTKSDVAEACLQHLDLSRYRRVIEPSAGAGAFSDLLFAVPGLNVEAFDLAPENEKVTNQDWFDYSDPQPQPTLVVGNPPFGQQCSLAVRFINHAFEVVRAQTVAFVLPRSFRKASVQDRLFAHARLAHEELLGARSFLLNGEDYDLPSVFQVWERTTSPRPRNVGPTTSPFVEFTKKDQPHDFAIRRVGGKAGFAFVDDPSTSPQSNYFLRLTDSSVRVEDVLLMVNGLDVSVADDGTGPRTLSKRELVALFDDAYRAQFKPAASAT